MKDILLDNNSLLSNGATQHSRSNPCLEEDFFLIDDRSTEEILHFIASLSKHVKFVSDKDNESESDWYPFFEYDITFLLARIAIYDWKEQVESFKKLLLKFEKIHIKSDSIEDLPEVANLLFSLWNEVDEWFKLSKKNEHLRSDHHLSILIGNAIIKNMLRHVGYLVHLDQFLRKEGLQSNLVTTELQPIWEVDEKLIQSKKDAPFNLKEKEVSKKLTRVFNDFIKAISHLIHRVPTFLNEMLSQYDKHTPNNALLITFAKLYQHIQSDINGLTKKHLEYYYRNVLHQEKMKAHSDFAYVVLQLADQARKLEIPAGTKFEAGTDVNGDPYFFESTESIDVNKGFVSELKALYVEKDPAVGDETPYQIISNIYQSEMQIEGIDPVEYEHQVFTTFGKKTELEAQSRQESKIGYAIESPVLMLREGVRMISLKFKFNTKSLTSFIYFLEQYTKEEGLTAESALHKIFNNSLDIFLTSGELGWFKTEEYNIIPPKDWSKGQFIVEIYLDNNAPPVIPLTEEWLVEEIYEGKWPVIKVLHSTEYSMYTYSFLKDLVIETCDVEVKATNVRNLSAYNNIGQLDISNPFFPFGTIPIIGSYFLIGNAELFIKTLTDLEINFEWHNLPRTKGGFTSYFKEYGTEIDNEVFKIKMTALSKGKFYPTDYERADEFNLFNSEKDRLSPFSQVKDMDLGKLAIEKDFSTIENIEYTSSSNSGFIKFELSDPEMGFGHDLYPVLFADQVIEKTKKGKGDTKVLNPPISPQLKSINLSYSANSTINFSTDETKGIDAADLDRYYHLGPFGSEITHENGIAYKNSLLPQFDDDGYLFVGIKNVKPGEVITLYFILQNDIGNTYELETPQIEWKYLNRNNWKAIDKQLFLSDSTNGFTISGIVKIRLPLDITDQNDIMPSGTFWLSASAFGNLNLISQIKQVHSQAIPVKWSPVKEDSPWLGTVPPGTISAIVGDFPDLESTLQITNSFGGDHSETTQEYYARVSERLRHKNRAVTNWDIEHIVLENFPLIEQVKCFGNLEAQKLLAPGEVLIVVVPKVRRNDALYSPKLNLKTLHQIRDFVTARSSLFSTVRVINPIYVQLKLRCYIKFVDNNKSGEYSKQLHDEFNSFLCPWFFAQRRAVEFKKNIKVEDIIGFLDGCNYIQYATKVSFSIVQEVDQYYEMLDSTDSEFHSKYDEIIKPYSILIPNEGHDLTIIEDYNHRSPEKAAIERMQLESDFIIMDSDKKGLEIEKDKKGGEEEIEIEFDFE